MTYSIVGGNTGNAFEVVADLGEIKVRGHLDYEDGPRVRKDELMTNVVLLRVSLRSYKNVEEIVNRAANMNMTDIIDLRKN